MRKKEANKGRGGRGRIERFHFEEKETIATILCERKYFDVARREISRQRAALEEYIRRDGFFKLTFEPHEPKDDAPKIAKLMARAASRMGVGPMAAVAGAIAHLAVRAMKAAGATFAVVDNGGDIALLLDRPLTVGLYAGQSRVRSVGFRVQPRKGIFGICTSSGTVGPSISLGKADAATVIAPDAVLADAAATALGNAVKGDTQKAIENALGCIKDNKIEGMVVITGSHMGVAGRVPPMIKVDNDYDIITKAK
jgi:hypothetical protein